ncbi:MULTISPECIES: hypothetical protein [Psychrilyobacter]|nr:MULTISPECIES: hypothetical protein [Psychrilyobacter]MCS5421894.1 hypothetical protein [Psychrilyobacter sp. S5]
MDFYKRMLIKILKNSMAGRESNVLKILESGYDLNTKDKEELEELIDNL